MAIVAKNIVKNIKDIEWVWIEYATDSFALECEDGNIISTPPLYKRYLGKDLEFIWRKIEARGGTVKPYYKSKVKFKGKK